MPNSQKIARPESAVSLMDAIYERRSVRDFKPQPIDKEKIRALLDAAIRAPNALREESWSFAILQDKNLMTRLSDSVKELIRNESKTSAEAARSLNRANDSDYNVFHRANTLVVICGKIQDPFVSADCWLAAENLMLAAHAMGLGSCVIGFAVAVLNTPEWKTELNISGDRMAIAPIILGVPVGKTPPVPRKEPQILTWR